MEHLSHILFPFLLSFVILGYYFRSRFSFTLLTAFILTLFVVFHVIPSTIHILHSETVQNFGFHDCCINPQLVLSEQSEIQQYESTFQTLLVTNDTDRAIGFIFYSFTRGPPLA